MGFADARGACENLTTKTIALGWNFKLLPKRLSLRRPKKALREIHGFRPAEQREVEVRDVYPKRGGRLLRERSGNFNARLRSCS